ncbi:methyltransferase-like protein 4 isoform X1 [Biomphalaria glabrata]|nr:methyltransferase-like protein 4 isoform X1 [Biomphalaria glabrata]
MSVVCQIKDAALLDHCGITEKWFQLRNEISSRENQFEKILSQTGDIVNTSKHEDCSSLSQTGNVNNYRMKSDLFAIEFPFMMDSQVKRLSSSQASHDKISLKESSADRKRKRKKQRRINTNADVKFISDLKTSLSDLITLSRNESYLTQDPEPYQRNDLAKSASQIHGCGDLFQLLCENLDMHLNTGSHYNETVPHDLNLGDQFHYSAKSLVGVCVRNEDCKLVKVGHDEFLIPKRCSFLTSSFDYFISRGYQQMITSQGFDLLVIDPPWPNKSVKRKKSYATFNELNLKSLPVHQLGKDGGLICIWVTNKEQLINFVKDELFPHWCVEWIADWFWMKVTKSGVPVCDINSSHKKPYEQLIIGRCNLSAGQVVTRIHKTLNNQLVEKQREKEMSPARLPQNFLIVSVPCSLHSKKPPLSDVFSPYLPPNPNCIELFARNLVPEWSSWGNEPLRHQHSDYFEPVLE